MKILHYNRIGVPKSINVNKTSVSRQYIICHYWHFIDNGFWFQSFVCIYCHVVLMLLLILAVLLF